MDLGAVAAWLARASSVCPAWENNAAANVVPKDRMMIIRNFNRRHTLEFG